MMYGAGVSTSPQTRSSVGARVAKSDAHTGTSPGQLETGRTHEGPMDKVPVVSRGRSAVDGCHLSKILLAVP
jgi:hypothetical protein